MQEESFGGGGKLTGSNAAVVLAVDVEHRQWDGTQGNEQEAEVDYTNKSAQ